MKCNRYYRYDLNYIHASIGRMNVIKVSPVIAITPTPQNKYKLIRTRAADMPQAMLSRTY